MLTLSGYKWQDILPCVQWMAPFAVTVRELGPIAVKFFPNIPSEDSHTIQTHVVDLSLLVSYSWLDTYTGESKRVLNASE